MSNYTEPGPYTLEALVEYLSNEFILNRGSLVGLWLILGNIMRLALRMGYHRDPRHYSEISPFDGEMRRRVWATLVPLDMLSSGQIGLPSMVKLSLVDTESPRNLLDQDFDKNTATLPPARPSSELTPISYTIIKAKIGAVFGRILDLTSSARPVLYGDVMEMERALLETHSEMPPGLTMRPIQSSIMDAPSLIMKRFNLDLLYQKARCILHRKFMVLAWTDVQYTASRQLCVQAALQMLQHQNTVHQEIKPGGVLESDVWMVSALTTHDFLLAAMILCLDLDHRRHPRGRSEEPGQGSPQELVEPQENDLLQALETSRGIWHASSHASAEAARAFQILSIMLGKLGPSATSLSDEGKDQAKDLAQALNLPAQGISSVHHR
jgi:hypothetical protein